MIVHLDSNNPKSIEQKVQELILKKLFIKVDDDNIFFDKQHYISLSLRNIIALAKAQFNIEEALQIIIKEQKEELSKINALRSELEEVSVDFQVEIEAYIFYLEGLGIQSDVDEVYLDVLLILNSEFELLENKLLELIKESIGLKISESDAQRLNWDRDMLIENYANHVKIIASHDTISDAVEELYIKNRTVNKKLIKDELEMFAPALIDEIKAYKIALSMNDQNAEFPMILAMVKQLLQLED